MLSPPSFLLASGLDRTLPCKDVSRLCLPYVSLFIRQYSSQVHALLWSALLDLNCHSNIHNWVLQPGESCLQIMPPNASTPLHKLFYACTLECIASCLLRCNDRSLSQIVIDKRESIYAHLAHAAVHGGRLPATSMRIHTRLPCGSLRCP